MRLTLSDANLNANLDADPPTGPWRIRGRKSAWRLDSAKGAARRDVEYDGDDARETAMEGSSWRVDEDHLEEVSRIWDMSVATFRDALHRHAVDDEPIAALQEAIRESAREHYVAEGMRRSPSQPRRRERTREREGERAGGRIGIGTGTVRSRERMGVRDRGGVGEARGRGGDEGGASREVQGENTRGGGGG